MRSELKSYVTGGKVEQISIATTSVEINDQTQNFLAVSGKSWKGNVSDIVDINGIRYTLVSFYNIRIPNLSYNNNKLN